MHLIFLYCLYFLTACHFQEVSAAILPPEAELFPSCSLTCLNTALESTPEIAQNIKKLCAKVDVEVALAACAKTSCNKADQTRVASANAKICQGEPTANRAPMAIVILGFLGTLTQSMIALRIYARRTLTSMGIDDYLIIAASFFVAFVMISGTVDVFLGLGRHTFNSKQSAILPTLFIFWLDELAYQIEMALVKSSILFFFLRVFPDRNFRIIVFGLLVWVNVTGAVFFFVTLFQCNPIRAAYDKSMDFVCIDNNAATFASSAVSIATDFTILILPIPSLLKLKVTSRRRIQLLVMFSFGLLASVISVARLPFIVEFGKSVDPIYENIIPGIWTFSEMASAVIVACLPSIKPLVAKWFPRIFSDDETPPLPMQQQVSPPTRRRPNPTTIFSSLFSRNEGEGRPAAGDQREYFNLEDGKIVPITKLSSRLSVDFVKEWKPSSNSNV